MPDTDAPTHKRHHTHPDSVSLRQPDDEDGLMELRLPIASTGDVRNEDDEPLTSRELRGMAEQVDSLTRGVFPQHGFSNMVDGDHYSQFEKLGYWSDASIEENASGDGEDLLMATARMPDPETLPAATGDYRQALAILKEQAIRGIPISASIGWRDDETAPGGVDLTEASIVGIGADPRTNTGGGEQLIARAAVEAGADPEALVDAVREAVTTDDDDMTDTDDAPDDEESEGATTDEVEQHANEDAETTETRSPEEIELVDWAELLASHIEGVDSADLMDAWDPFAEDYIGEVDLNELAAFIGDVTDTETGEVQEMLEDLRDRENDDEDDDEEENEQEGDHPDDDDDDDDEQSADDPDETQGDDTSELEQRLDDLEEELQAVRSGDVDVETPDTPDEDGETEDEAEEQRSETERDPAEKPAWAR